MKGISALLCGAAMVFPMQAAMAQADTAAVIEQQTVEDIVVTATRREERLQQVPISVTAVTAAGLERAGISDTRQLTATIPALNFSRSNSAFQPTIRGVGTRGNGAGDESSVAVYIDGIYQPELSALSFDLVNIERVEVLRGPQGTLFGRNSTGGLVNIITKDPKHETDAKAVFRFGRFQEISAQVYYTTGLTDKIAFDFSGLVREDEGYIRDLVNGGRVGDRKARAVRSKLLIEPDDRTRFVLTGSYSHTEDNASVSGQPFNGNTSARVSAPGTLIASQPWETALTLPRALTNEQYAFSLEGRIDLGAVTLESSTAYQSNRIVVETDNDATPADIGRTHVEPRSHYVSQEIRLLSNSDGPLKYIAGVFMISGLGKFDPLQSTTGGTSTSVTATQQKVRSGAAFAEATYEFAPEWFAVGGVRYTRETRRFEGTTTRNGAVVVTGGITQQVPADTRTTFGQWTYRASLQKRFGDRANVYATYSRGFKSGVFNTFSASAASKPTNPEKLDAFEIGLKADPLPWLRTNFSLFHYNYKDIQLSARDNSGLVILLNAARAKIKGGEIEVTVTPLSGFNVRSYATYIDGKYSSFPNAQIFEPTLNGSGVAVGGNTQKIVDMSGRRVIRAPKVTFGLNGDYSCDTALGKAGISANLFHSAKYYWDVNNRLTQPAYTQLNGELSLMLKGDKVRLGVWGQNLTNAKIFQQMLPSGTADVVSYERPRSYGVTAQISL